MVHAVRRAAKTDVTQAEIVKKLRSLGCLVQDLSAVGKGVPDLLVLLPCSKLVFVEVKSDTKTSHRATGKALTPRQEEFHKAWRRAPLFIVRTVDEASMLVKEQMSAAVTRARMASVGA